MDAKDILPAVEISKQIADNGILIVVAAVWILSSFIMLFFFLRWFIKVVNGIINTQKNDLTIILELQKMQDSKLTDIKGLLNSEMLNQVKILFGFAFDWHKLAVINIIKQIISENNLNNRELVERKLSLSLKNLFDDCKTKFSNFSYNGKKLSYYMDDAWLDNLQKNCIDEIYGAEEFIEENVARHITLLFDGIKIEFQNNLLKMQ